MPTSIHDFPILEPAAGNPNCEYLDMTLPGSLLPVLRRHHANLARLIESMQSGGVPDQAIRAGVDALVESYRAELKKAVVTL